MSDLFKKIINSPFVGSVELQFYDEEDNKISSIDGVYAVELTPWPGWIKCVDSNQSAFVMQIPSGTVEIKIINSGPEND